MESATFARDGPNQESYPGPGLNMKGKHTKQTIKQQTYKSLQIRTTAVLQTEQPIWFVWQEKIHLKYS
ncbi:hypothetical protein CBL_04887 [Carabus blaptoides fortunei]